MMRRVGLKEGFPISHFFADDFRSIVDRLAGAVEPTPQKRIGEGRLNPPIQKGHLIARGNPARVFKTWSVTRSSSKRRTEA